MKNPLIEYIKNIECKLLSHGFPGLFTVTSEHNLSIFLVFSFLFYTFLVVGSIR